MLEVRRGNRIIRYVPGKGVEVIEEKEPERKVLEVEHKGWKIRYIGGTGVYIEGPGKRRYYIPQEVRQRVRIELPEYLVEWMKRKLPVTYRFIEERTVLEVKKRKPAIEVKPRIEVEKAAEVVEKVPKEERMSVKELIEKYGEKGTVWMKIKEGLRWATMAVSGGYVYVSGRPIGLLVRIGRAEPEKIVESIKESGARVTSVVVYKEPIKEVMEKGGTVVVSKTFPRLE